MKVEKDNISKLKSTTKASHFYLKMITRSGSSEQKINIISDKRYLHINYVIKHFTRTANRQNDLFGDIKITEILPPNVRNRIIFCNKKVLSFPNIVTQHQNHDITNLWK